MKDFRFNLLSPEYQAVYKKRVLARLLFATGGLIVAWALVFCVPIFTAVEYLSIQNKAISRSVESLEAEQAISEVKDFQNQMKQLNIMLDRLKSLQEKEKNDALTITTLVASKVPPGITLKEFTYAPQTGTVFLNGKADLRTTLLAFENKLRAEPRFVNIEAPVGNLTKPTNADFRFTITLEDANELK